MDASFSFLNEIPDKTGYIALVDGSVVKSDGDLQNEETLAMTVMRMLRIGEPLIQIEGESFEKMTIKYPKYSLEVVKSGKYVFIVKVETKDAC